MHDLRTRFVNVVAAEWTKLRTLPLAVAAMIATIVAGALVAASVAADRATPVSVLDAVVGAVPFAQVGFIMLGIIPAAHEYAGPQHRTSAVAVPDRRMYLAGKTFATVIVVVGAAVTALGAGVGAAALTQQLLDAPASSGTAGWRELVGAGIYLALIGLLAHTVAVLLRHLVPALVVMLMLVLIVPPLAGGITEHARWLPERAGSLLYRPDADDVLTAGSGGAILLGWVLVIGFVAAVTVLARDT